jgi:hypothetical protein
MNSSLRGTEPFIVVPIVLRHTTLAGYARPREIAFIVEASVLSRNDVLNVEVR